MTEPQVPNTITDKQMASLQRRAQKGPDGAMFTDRAIKRRRANEAQQKKARLG